MDNSSFVLTMFMSYAAMAGDCTPSWEMGVADPGASATVSSFAVHDFGSGDELVAVGAFTSIGGTNAARVASWSNGAWTALATSTDANMADATSFGGELWVSGGFTQIDGVVASMVARYNGTNWTSAASGFNRTPNVLHEIDGDLYAGGGFWLSGGTPVRAVSRWDGGAWVSVGQGLIGEVFDLAADPGGAPVAVGSLEFAIGGDELSNVARFDGAGWEDLGGGFDATARAVLTADLGGGAALYAGGDFTSNVVVFDGVAWQPLASGPGGPVYDLFVADLGSGDQLVAAGDFGPSSAGAIAAWDGASWTIVAGGLGQDGGAPEARALGTDPASGALAVGGRFDKAGGAISQNIALLNLCDASNPADLDGDGVVGSGDLAFLLAAWGGSGADLDGDGVTGSSDLAVVLAAWD